MRKSKFTTILKKENKYVLHNSLSNLVIKVDDENEQEMKKMMKDLEEDCIFYDENNEFQKTLLDGGFIIKEDENEIATLNSLHMC